MNPRVNEELIDSLVCGTLAGAEYRKAILALESDPQKWRDCALAFLQEQAISQELDQLSQSNVSWQKSQPDPTALSVVTNRQLIAREQKLASQKDNGWFYKLGTLAALLLLSFSVGWIGSSIRDKSLLADQGEDTTADLAHAPNLKVDRMSLDQILPATKFGSNNYSLVGNSRTLLPIDEQIPANLVKLEKEGRVRLETTTALMPVDFESGTMLVPVQQIRVVPVTFSY